MLDYEMLHLDAARRLSGEYADMRALKKSQSSILNIFIIERLGYISSLSFS